MKKSKCIFCENELIQCFQDDENCLMDLKYYDIEDNNIYVYYFCKKCGFHSPYAIGETEEEASMNLETQYNNQVKRI